MQGEGNAQDRNREKDKTEADSDTVHDPAFDEFLGRNARWQFSSKKIPAFGTPHLGVRNFHRERIDHCIAMLAHLIKHFLDVKLHVVGPHEIESDPL